MTPTGIPPHVVILRQIKNMNIDVKNAIDTAFQEHSLAQPNVSRNWMETKMSKLEDAVTSLTNIVRNRSTT